MSAFSLVVLTMETKLAGTREVLLKRQGLVFAEPSGAKLPEDYIRAVEIKLAELGFVPSTRFDRDPRVDVGRVGSQVGR